MDDELRKGKIFGLWDKTFLKHTPWLKDRWTFAVAEVAILGSGLLFPVADFITKTWYRESYIPDQDWVYTLNTPTHRVSVFKMAGEKGMFVRPHGFFKEWRVFTEESIPEFVEPVFDKQCSRKERKRLITQMIKLRAFL